ncbi:MAG: T9SS type A sorting domain-containing protein [Ignavibacteriaceae bacterium]|nr:T9SS type A sorting domain-containing protein [Ignavibacteriaceae bacterium]
MIPTSPGGTLPGALTNLAPQYWAVTVTSGTVNGTYCMTLDLTGVPGISNYATLHLLKRDNASGSWVDIGVPTDVAGAPVVQWCYPAFTSFSEFSIGSDAENPLPVELSAFTATAKLRDVTLNWETKTEINSSSFNVERRIKGDENNNGWLKAAEVSASGNSNSPKQYSCIDKKLDAGAYEYRLKMIDNDGKIEYSQVIETEVEVPREYALTQNYPNPFNPSTKIDYQIPYDASVTLELYAITGERVAVLIGEEQSAGYYTYQLSGRDLRLASGVYIYRLIARDKVNSSAFMQVKKMVLLK